MKKRILFSSVMFAVLASIIYLPMGQAKEIRIKWGATSVRSSGYAHGVLFAKAVNQAYNIAVSERTTLNELFRLLKSGLRRRDKSLPDSKPVHRDFRAGDVRHSLADISKARRLLGFAPTHTIRDGLDAALDWYKKDFAVRQ